MLEECLKKNKIVFKIQFVRKKNVFQKQCVLYYFSSYVKTREMTNFIIRKTNIYFTKKLLIK